MVGCDKSVFILSGCDTETINSYLPCIQTKLQENQHGDTAVRPLVVVDCVGHGGTAADGVYNLSQYYMSLCRKYALLANERSTLLSGIDQLIALQLCLAEKNKQERGEYDVETSTVLQTNKEIIRYKMSEDPQQKPEILPAYQAFLKHCNYIDMCDLYKAVMQAGQNNESLVSEIAGVDFLLISHPDSVVEKAMVRYLCEGRTYQSVTVEVPLETEELREGENLHPDINISCNDMTLEEVLHDGFEESFSKASPRTGVSITQSYVQLVFVSYLELLVNSRSELALARAINTPERELTHTAFTDLKHEASNKGMTMYQTAVSFVMKLRLGGKGYAPDSDHPLAQHVKGLGEFVTLVQRLQTIIEEDLDKRTSCRRVLNVIKKEILKCKDNRLRTSSVESVCTSLQAEVVNIINMLDKSPASSSPEKAVRDGGSMVGRHTLKVLGYIVDKLVSGMDRFKMQTLDFLCDGFSSQATPVRFSCILSQFTSPTEEPDSPDSKYNKSLSERLLGSSDKKSTPLHQKRYKSSLSWADPSSIVDKNKDEQIFLQKPEVYVAPSKTMVQPGCNTVVERGIAKKVVESINDQENCPITSCKDISSVTSCVDQSLVSKAKEAKKVDRVKKRTAESDLSSSQVSKKIKKEKTCKRKLLPQVKGQQQLTKFFRV